MSIIKYIKSIKEEVSNTNPYLICIDDKIVHASSVIIKLIKIDPIGMSLTTFLSIEDREEVLESIRDLQNGPCTRQIRIGNQLARAVFNSKREKIEDKVVSTIFLRDAALLNEGELQPVRPLRRTG